MYMLIFQETRRGRRGCHENGETGSIHSGIHFQDEYSNTSNVKSSSHVSEFSHATTFDDQRSVVQASAQHFSSVANYAVNSKSESLKFTARRLITRSTSFSEICTKTPNQLFQHDESNRKPDIPKKPLSRKWAWLNNEEVSDSKPQSSTTPSFPSGKNQEFSSISTRLRSLSLSTVPSTETEKSDWVPQRRKSTKIKEMARRFEAFKTVDGSDVKGLQEKPFAPPKRIIVPIANPDNLHFSTDSLHSASSSTEPSMIGSSGLETRFTSSEQYKSKLDAKAPSPSPHTPKTGEESMKEEPLTTEGLKGLERNISVCSQNGENSDDSIELGSSELQSCHAELSPTRPAKESYVTEDGYSVIVEDASAAVLGDSQTIREYDGPLVDLPCLKNVDSGTLDIRYETNTNVDENQLQVECCKNISPSAAHDSHNIIMGFLSSQIDITNPDPESSVIDVLEQVSPSPMFKTDILSANSHIVLNVSESVNPTTSISSANKNTEENSKDVIISPEQNSEKSPKIFCSKGSIKDVIADESEEIIFEKKTPPNQRLYSFVVDEDATSYQITSLSAISGEESSDPDSGDDEEEKTFTEVNLGSESVPGFKRETTFVSNFNENGAEKLNLTSRKPDCGCLQPSQSDYTKETKSPLQKTELSHTRNKNEDVTHSGDLNSTFLSDKQGLSSSNQILTEILKNERSKSEHPDKVTEEGNSESIKCELQTEGREIQKKTEFDDQMKDSTIITSTHVNPGCLDSSKDSNDSINAGSECVSVHVWSHPQEIVPGHEDYNYGFIKNDNLEVEKSDGIGFEKYDSSEIESGTGSFSGSPDHCLKISGSISISEDSGPEMGLKSSSSPENSLENRPLTPSPPSSPSSTNTAAQQHSSNFPEEDMIPGEDEIFSSHAEDNQAEDNPLSSSSSSCEEDDSTSDILESVAKRFCEVEEDKSSITQTSLSSVLGSDQESQKEVDFEVVVEAMTERGVAELATLETPTVQNSVLSVSDTGCVNHNFHDGEEGGEILSNSEKQFKEPSGDENIIVSSFFNESVSSGTSVDLNYSTFVKRREISSQLFSDSPPSQQAIGTDARLKSLPGISNDLTVFSQDLENSDQQILPVASRSSVISSCSEVSETATECSEMTAEQDDLVTDNTASISTVRQTVHSHDMSALTGKNRVSLSGGELHAVRVRIDLGSEESMQKLKQLKIGGSKTSVKTDDGSDVVEVRVEDMDDISDATFLTAEDIRKMTSTEKPQNQPLIITPDTQHIDSYDFLDLSPQLHTRRSLSPRITENAHMEGLGYHHDHTIDYDYVPSPVDMEEPGKSYSSDTVRASSPQEGTAGTFSSSSANFEKFVYSSHRSVDLSSCGVTKVLAANNMVTKFERKKSYQPLEQIKINFDSDSEVRQSQTSSRNVTFTTVDFNKKLIEHEPEPKRSKSWKKNSLKGIFRKMKSITNNSVDLAPEAGESEMEISGPILISSSSEARAKTSPNAGSYSFSTQKVILEELSISELDNSVSHSVYESPDQRSTKLGSGVQIIDRVDGFFIPNPNQDSGHTQSQIDRPNLTQGRNDSLNSMPGSIEDSSGVHPRLVFKKSNPLAPDPFSYEADNSSIKKGADTGHTTSSRNGIDKLAKVIKWKRK